MMEVRKSGVLWTLTLLIILFALCPEIGKAQYGRPVADAGLPRYAAQDPVVLDGTGSYDPDNSGTLSYTWQQISGPSVIIIDSNTATPSIGGYFTVPGRGGIPRLGGFTQTDEIQVCEFELVISDGEFTSLPDIVQVNIVPDFGDITLEQQNPPFDPNKPTVFYFSGGRCEIGYANEEPWGYADWFDKANIINFPQGYEPDITYESYRTFYHMGDMIIVFLSSVAPVYYQPIQTIGWSAGEQPAMDAAIRINRVYKDSRYAINHVTRLDAPCRWMAVGDVWRPSDAYIEALELFLGSSVDGEQCWCDTYAQVAGEDIARGGIHVDLGGIGHPQVRDWYRASITNPQANAFNNGIIGGAYWSVVGPGKNLQPSQDVDYRFRLIDDIMHLAAEETYPARLPEPVTLVGPEDGAFVDPNGAVFSCEVSENAVGYQLLFGTDPYRVMDYHVVSDTTSPPTEIITSFPYEQTWWTVRVYDAFGSTIYADPHCINASFPTYAKYSGGTGEPNNPYQIATAEDLMLLGESPDDYDKHFIMIDDIDLHPHHPSDVFDRAVIAPDTNDIEPGFQGISFRGVFDGDGHTISNLTIKGESYLGLFGLLKSGSKVRDLGIVNVNVNGSGEQIGGLVGLNAGSIAASYSTGVVLGYENVGGLVGHNYYHHYSEGSITTSYSYAAVTGNDDVGGLVGDNTGSITASCSTGVVRGNENVGGLVGENWGQPRMFQGRITTSYSTSKAKGTQGVGGLVGNNSWGSISTSYSAGSVSGESGVGGLVGHGVGLSGNPVEGMTSESFWDVEASGQSSSAGGTGKTTTEMQTARTFLEAGWDFVDETENGIEDIWWIDEGQDYPKLWWELIPEN